MVYLRARYYDPTTGRFTSTDPLNGTTSDPLTQNGYNYANNNPVNLNDPAGLSASCDTGSTNSSYSTPNPVVNYVHWLAAGGSTETMDAGQISWRLDVNQVLLRAGAGVKKDLSVSASASGTANAIGFIVNFKTNGTIRPTDYDIKFANGGYASQTWKQ